MNRIHLLVPLLAAAVFLGQPRSLAFAQKPKELPPLEAHKTLSWVRCLAFSPDGKILASGVENYEDVILWDVATRKVMDKLPRTVGVHSLSFSADSKKLATASGQGEKEVQVWDLATKKSVTVHHPGVLAVALSPDGKLLVTAGRGEPLVLWDAATGKEAKPLLRGHDDVVYRVVFSPDGKHLASASADKTVRLWDIRTGDSRVLKMDHDPVGVAFSPDSKTLAVGAGISVYLVDVAQAKTKARLDGHTDEAYLLAFSPKGQLLATRQKDQVLLWDSSNNKKVAELRGVEYGGGLAFSPDGSLLAVGTTNGTIRLWDVTGLTKR